MWNKIKDLFKNVPTVYFRGSTVIIPFDQMRKTDDL
jgi:hypothetical protein